MNKVSQNTPFWEHEKRTLVKIPSIFSTSFCEKQGNEKLWKETATYTDYTRFWRSWTLPTTVLTLLETGEIRSNIEVEDMCGYRKPWCPISSLTNNSFSKLVETAYFNAKVYNFFSSKALLPFLLSANTGSTRNHGTLSKKNPLGLQLLIHWRSYAFGFCEKSHFISSQGLGHTNPYHTLLHCRIIPCLSILVGSVCYLITWMSYTLHHYIVELYPTLIQCWGILYFLTLRSSTQS